MGLMLKAICENCNYEEMANMGYGFNNKLKDYEAPALYHRAKSIRTKNLYNETLKGEYTFYTDPKMYKGVIDENPITFGDVSIKALENYCPKCNLFTMKFEIIGEWD